MTLFPIDTITRANLFLYRSLRDPWLQALRTAPVPLLSEALPGLTGLLGPFEVCSRVLVRPADLYTIDEVARPGLVLVGDAQSTSCPAAGTGCNKVFTDAVRLCRVHVPRWLETPGMGTEKLQAFYTDPEKVACDAWSLRRALDARRTALDTDLRGRMRRRVTFLGQLGLGTVRSLRARTLE